MPSSAQFVLLLDTTYTHGAQADTRPNAAFPMPESVPADWSGPADYAAGTVHFRLEVVNKPTGVAIQYLPCMEQGATRACATAQLLADSGATGAVYTWSRPLAQWTPSGTSWATRPGRHVLVLRDAYGIEVAPEEDNWIGQPYVGLYYPMTVRFSSAVVAGGETFPGWDGLITVGVEEAARRAAFTAPAMTWSGSPSHGALQVRFRAASPSPVEMRIWDTRGRLMGSDKWLAASASTQVRQVRLSGGSGSPAVPLILELRTAGRVWRQVFSPPP